MKLFTWTKKENKNWHNKDTKTLSSACAPVHSTPHKKAQLAEELRASCLEARQRLMDSTIDRYLNLMREHARTGKSRFAFACYNVDGVKSTCHQANDLPMFQTSSRTNDFHGILATDEAV